MSMDDPFQDPATGGTLASYEGCLLLITVREYLPKVRSDFATEDGSGMTEAVDCSLVVLDGKDDCPVSVDRMRILSQGLMGQLKPRLGGMVLGRLGKMKFKPQFPPGWNLTPATEDEKVKAREYIASMKAKTEKDPFSVEK